MELTEGLEFRSRSKLLGENKKKIKLTDEGAVLKWHRASSIVTTCEARVTEREAFYFESCCIQINMIRQQSLLLLPAAPTLLFSAASSGSRMSPSLICGSCGSPCLNFIVVRFNNVVRRLGTSSESTEAFQLLCIYEGRRRAVLIAAIWNMSGLQCPQRSKQK